MLQSILISLTGFVLLTDFKTKNKFPELLPPGSLFFSNPISYIQQYFSVYKLHSSAYLAEQQEKRARGLDEVRKRKEYLIAHGIDKEGILGFGTVEGDARKEKRAKQQEEYKEFERKEEEKHKAILQADSMQGSRGDDAHEDVQTQLVLLEQQNVERPEKARQELERSRWAPDIPAVSREERKVVGQSAEDMKENSGEETGKKGQKWLGIW